jgi:predicted Zn-dependent protease
MKTFSSGDLGVRRYSILAMKQKEPSTPRWQASGLFSLMAFHFALLAQSPVTTSTLAPAEVTIASLRHNIDTGHPDEALRRIAAARADRVTLAGMSRVEGLADYASNDLKAADAAFAKALVEDPKDGEAAEMRGLTLFRLGKPVEAIPLLESASKQGTLGQADPNYILALCYMDTRRYDDARRAFAAQYGFAPDSASAYLVAARMLLRREYLPVSQGFAQKAIEIDPALPLAHELLGEIALASSRFDEAIAEFEKEKARNPLEPSVYDRLGDAYSREAKYDDAQRNLQRAVLLEPNSTGPYILLGKTMLRKSDPVAAATYLEHAGRLDPGNYITHSLLGQAYRVMGRPEDAAREAATAQKLQTASEPKIETLH